MLILICMLFESFVGGVFLGIYLHENKDRILRRYFRAGETWHR